MERRWDRGLTRSSPRPTSRDSRLGGLGGSVEGPPIRSGAVAIGDDGTIAAVGSIDELGEGDRYRNAVILPGFVNAHSHLEYAVYGGFGDGLPFSDWIGLHVQRKRLIDLADMEAIARLGALDCLRSGITTVGDCSFSGAAATACADLGLRGTIYPEVFGESPDVLGESFEPTSGRIAGALSDDVRMGVSPHAPYTCSLDLYRACDGLGVPVATHLAESEAETEFLLTGKGAWESFADMLVRPPGTTGIHALADAGVLGPHARRPLRPGRRRGDRDPRRQRRRRCALPRSNAIGGGGAPLSALRPQVSVSASRPTAPLRRPRSTCSTRCVQRWPRHEPANVAPMRSRQLRRLELATSAVPVHSARTPSSDRSRLEEGRPDDPLARGHPSSHGKIRLRPLFSEARRNASSLLSCPVKPATRRRGRHVRADRRRAQRPRPAAGTRPDVVIEDTCVLPAPSPKCEVGVPVPRACLRAGLRGVRVGAGGVGVGDIFRGTGGASGVPRSPTPKAHAGQSEGREGVSRPRHGTPGRGNTDEAIQALESPVTPPQGRGCAETAGCPVPPEARRGAAAHADRPAPRGLASHPAWRSRAHAAWLDTRSIRPDLERHIRAPSRRRARRRTQTPNRGVAVRRHSHGDSRQPTRRTRASARGTAGGMDGDSSRRWISGLPVDPEHRSRAESRRPARLSSSASSPRVRPLDSRPVRLAVVVHRVRGRAGTAVTSCGTGATRPTEARAGNSCSSTPTAVRATRSRTPERRGPSDRTSTTRLRRRASRA